jgi:ketosteroid isomerase-like protein
MGIRWKVDRTKVDRLFANDVDTYLATDPADWVVTYGFRTREEQAELYRKFLEGGPRAAPPGKSAHEYMLEDGTPAARAVDVTLIVNGEDNWDYKNSQDWRRMIAGVQAHPRLHSLVNIGDADHIERVRWRDAGEL